MGKERFRNLEDQNWSIAILWVIENGMIKMTVGVGPQNSSADPGTSTIYCLTSLMRKVGTINR
jgi:hypothetical protein